MSVCLWFCWKVDNSCSLLIWYCFQRRSNSSKNGSGSYIMSIILWNLCCNCLGNNSLFLISRQRRFHIWIESWLYCSSLLGELGFLFFKTRLVCGIECIVDEIRLFRGPCLAGWIELSEIVKGFNSNELGTG